MCTDAQASTTLTTARAMREIRAAPGACPGVDEGEADGDEARRAGADEDRLAFGARRVLGLRGHGGRRCAHRRDGEPDEHEEDEGRCVPAEERSDRRRRPDRERGGDRRPTHDGARGNSPRRRS